MEGIKKLKLGIKDIIIISILIAIFIVSFLISLQTELDMHPDENVHYAAVKYYQTHNMPPKFTQDDIKDTFSVHGESRLTELDSYYFLVGKYTSILSNIVVTSNNNINVFIARSFNLILLAVILVMCYKLYRNGNYLFMPILLISQVWYIFSYVNNDAWAIFLNLILVYQLFFKNSIFNKYIHSSKEELKKEKKKIAFHVILLGLLFYLLLIAKINYLIATGISCILYLIINNKIIFTKERIMKILSILVIGLVAFGVRLGIDYGINRLDRIKNMEQIRISRADEQFIPPYPAGPLNGNFRWSQREKPINNVIQNKEFYTKTAFSFVGVYGYMNKYAPKILYYVIFASYIIFYIYIIVSNIKNRKEKEEENKGRILPIILVLFAGIITLAFSIYRSYTYDFQPQGRYLFPIIPLLCALMYNQKKNKMLEIFIFIIAIVLIYMYIAYGYCKLI